jgi:hypothetical protein
MTSSWHSYSAAGETVLRPCESAAEGKEWGYELSNVDQEGRTNQSDPSAESRVRWWMILEWGMMHLIRCQRRARLVELGFVGRSNVGGECYERAVILTPTNILMLFHAMIKEGTCLCLRSWRMT